MSHRHAAKLIALLLLLGTSLFTGRIALADSEAPLRVGDVVKVILPGETAFDASLQIDADGRIALPEAGVVRIAGLVISRQRPGTATGVVFVTLEDEFGVANIIVWNSIVQRQRRELLSSRLLGVRGEVQREGKVIHVVAHQLEDHSEQLLGLRASSRDFH